MQKPIKIYAISLSLLGSEDGDSSPRPCKSLLQKLQGVVQIKEIDLECDISKEDMIQENTKRGIHIYFVAKENFIIFRDELNPPLS